MNELTAFANRLRRTIGDLVFEVRAYRIDGKVFLGLYRKEFYLDSFQNVSGYTNDSRICEIACWDTLGAAIDDINTPEMRKQIRQEFDALVKHRVDKYER